MFTARWWKDETTPRWALVIGGALTLVLTAGLTNIGGHYVNNAKRTNDSHAEQIKSLLDSMAGFQTASASFSNELMDSGKASAETKASLIRNLNEQIARLDSVQSFLDSSQLPQLSQYKKIVVSTIISIPEAITGSNEIDYNKMKKYWEAANDLLFAKKQITPKLERDI